MADISVIIPSHNVPDLVGQTLDSVLQQTCPVREVLVVDDSTDNTPRVVEEYVRRHGGLIRLIHVEPCTNSHARNLGLEQARGGLIAFLDSDDIWLPDKIRRQVELLEKHPEAVGAFCRLFTFHERLDDMGRPDWKKVRDDPSLADILLDQMVGSSMILMRAAAAAAVRFDESTNHAEDTIYTAEVRLQGPWRCVNEQLLGRRVRRGQLTGSPWHTIHNAQTRLRWIEANRGRIGGELADAVQGTIRARLIEFIEARYGRGQMEEFTALRDEVAKLCPREYAASFLSGKRIYPPWVYRLARPFRTLAPPADAGP